MIFLTAIAGAAFAYFFVDLCFSAAFSKTLALHERLKSVEDMGKRQRETGELDISISERIMRPVFNRILTIFSVFAPKNPVAVERMEQQLRQGRNSHEIPKLQCISRLLYGSLHCFGCFIRKEGRFFTVCPLWCTWSLCRELW